MFPVISLFESEAGLIWVGSDFRCLHQKQYYGFIQAHFFLKLQKIRTLNNTQLLGNIPSSTNPIQKKIKFRHIFLNEYK
jgi:hypothetical protein